MQRTKSGDHQTIEIETRKSIFFSLATLSGFALLSHSANSERLPCALLRSSVTNSEVRGTYIHNQVLYQETECSGQRTEFTRASHWSPGRTESSGGLRRECPGGPDRPASISRWLKYMGPEGEQERTLWAGVEEGHWWVCLLSRVTGDYAGMGCGESTGVWSKGKEKGLFSEEACVGPGTDSMLGLGESERSSE